MLNLVATFSTLDFIFGRLKWIVSLTHLLTTRFALLTIHFLFVAAMFESIVICTSEFALIIPIKTIHLLAIRLIVMMCYIISFQLSIAITLALTSVTHILIALVFASVLSAPDVNRCIANVTLNSISFGLEPCLVLTLV